MNPKWVELLSDHPTHGAKGKRFELPEKDADTLIAAGVAKACEKPEGEPTPEAKELAERLLKSVKAEVGALKSEIITELKNETKTGFAGITKSFGSLANPATAKDAATEARFGFKSVTEFFHAVHKGSPSKDGAPIPANADERLIKAAQGLNTNVGVDGGYLVPMEFSNRVLEHAWKESPLVGGTDQYTVSGNSVEFTALKESSRATGSRRGGMRSYWLSEADQFTKSKPTFRKFTVKPHKLGVFSYATEEQMNDTGFGFGLESKLAQYAGEEIRFQVADAVYRGDGVGKPLGILNAACTVSVAAEGGQTADTINFVNIYKMYQRMLPDSLGAAFWVTNIECLSQFLVMKWPDASGTLPAWLPSAQAPAALNAPAGTLMGRPLYIIEHASAIGDLGDIAFIDPRHYVLATKGGVNSAMSIHVRFDYEEICWRFSFRVDGQPWLESAITPYKGGSSLSPFVTLAAR
jgi:HK97 family phage major capsid protein